MKIKNQQFGDWRPQKKLGDGGNGEVWLAVNSKIEEAAVKILCKLKDKSKKEAYSRFRSEVDVLRNNSDIEGLLPVIDYDLPSELDDKTPWYVMPVAQPVTKYLEGRSYEIDIRVILEIGKILVKLHERDICHRDIKPANILERDGKFFLSDFGLVDYPEKKDVTKLGTRIGARWTIAPEMERDSLNADGKPADVYSLAKTLWIFLTGCNDGFEGQYDPQSVNGLSNISLTESENRDHFLSEAPSLYLRPVDDLLKESTDNDPKQRPSINQFVERLTKWLMDHNVFEKRNPEQWGDSQAMLFPSILPERAIWERTEAIIEVLNFLGSDDRQCHLLLPGGGGLDLLGANIGLEPETIELKHDEGVVCLVKPKRLVFESFNFENEWNYFMLETGEIEPTGIGSIHDKQEVLVEIAPLKYISEAESYSYDEGNGEYRSESRIVCRFTGGNFMILQKTSSYNRSGYTYDGRHDQMETDEFREYISGNVQQVRQMREDEIAAKIALDKKVTIDDLIFAFLNQQWRKESIERYMC